MADPTVPDEGSNEAMMSAMMGFSSFSTSGSKARGSRPPAPPLSGSNEQPIGQPPPAKYIKLDNDRDSVNDNGTTTTTTTTTTTAQPGKPQDQDRQTNTGGTRLAECGGVTVTREFHGGRYSFVTASGDVGHFSPQFIVDDPWAELRGEPRQRRPESETVAR